jgi:two-component system, LytTR family, sensor kinase
MKKVRYIIGFILIIGLTAALIVKFHTYDKPTISNGVLDLTSWDSKKDGNVVLDGRWEFYWEKLLDSSNISQHKPDLIVDIPNTWDKYSIGGQRLLGQGFATYRLHAKTNLAPGALLGLRIDTFSSAYSLYVNDKLIAFNGRVSDTAEEERGDYTPKTAFFNAPDKEFDIIINVSNFHYAHGGFWRNILIGSSERILNSYLLAMCREFFIIGALMIIAVLYFAVYILNDEVKYPLYFSLLCIFAAIALDFEGQLVMPRIVREMSFNNTLKVLNSSTAWALFFLVSFESELFASKISKPITKAYLLILSVLQLVYIFVPVELYSKFTFFMHFGEVSGILSAVIIVLKGYKKGKLDSVLNLVSVVIILVGYTYDIFYESNLLKNNYGKVFYKGLFVVICIEMIIQAYRTQMLTEEKVASELSALQAQIKPHFLYNALNTIISVSRYDYDKARELLVDFSNYLRRSFDFRDSKMLVPLKNEIELAKAYIEIEKARFEDKLQVTLEVNAEPEIMVPKVMLQPLIENAIKHGIALKKGRGRVEVLINRSGNLLFFRIKDNGVGMMSEDIIDDVEKHKGSGIGITNINSRLKKLYGSELQIISHQETGTEVAWTIKIKGQGEY